MKPGCGSVNGSNCGFENPAYRTVGPSTNPGFENPVYDSVGGMVNLGKSQCYPAALLMWCVHSGIHALIMYGGGPIPHHLILLALCTEVMTNTRPRQSHAQCNGRRLQLNNYTLLCTYVGLLLMVPPL